MRQEKLIDPDINLLQKFMDNPHEGYCYTVSGLLGPFGKDRLNILFIAYPSEPLKAVGKMLDEMGHYGGAIIIQENYGANRWMKTGQVDLIIGYDLNAGEADWLGKCYDVARHSNAPLCLEFLKGRDFDGWEDFPDKFKAFMKERYRKEKKQMSEEPSAERIRKITDKEIGWRGKELLSCLRISSDLTAYLIKMGMIDRKLPLKGTVRDLVHNFVIMVEGKPVFSGAYDKQCEQEIKFLLEQLGYLPRPTIDRGEMRIEASTPITDDIIRAVLESSIKQHGHDTTISFDEKSVRIVRGELPVSSEECTDVITYDLDGLQKLIDGSATADEWFGGSMCHSLKERTTSKTDVPFVKNGIAIKWVPKAYDCRDITIDRALMETLIRIEESIRIPNFAYEAAFNDFYHEKSIIPLQQIA